MVAHQARKRKSDDKQNRSRGGCRIARECIEPGMQGIFITTTRGKEKLCSKEMIVALENCSKSLYPDLLEVEIFENCQSTSRKLELELQKLRTKPELLIPIDCKTACVIFFSVHKDIDPVKLVEQLFLDMQQQKYKPSRFAQRILPISLICTASMKNLQTKAPNLINTHFQDTKGIPFAIRTSFRSHNTLKRDDVISLLAEMVGSQHKTDLKNFEKLIIVEVFKFVIGISVVQSFQSYFGYNISRYYENAIIAKH